MPRRPSLTAPLITLAIAVSVVASWQIFARSEADRYERTQSIARSRSEIRLQLTIRHDRGPIGYEAYRMADIDGRSTASYVATNRAGLRIEVDTLPTETYDVSFFFDRVVADGIWELPSRPPRGDTADHYDVSVSQLVAGQRGSHSFSFTDPHYWATTAGRQYRIHLDRSKPTPDLLKLASTSLAEPRYAKIVDDFRNYGTQRFRATIAAQQARLRSRRS
jgi:hypothetical protein